MAWDTSCFITTNILDSKGKDIGDGVASIKCLESLFSHVVQALVALAGVALFIMLLVGGFTFLFSGGDQKKLEAAKGTITNAIIGLVIIVCAYLILRTIQTFTGVTVTEFQVNPPPFP
jgi:Type IV secretion system pilin